MERYLKLCELLLAKHFKCDFDIDDVSYCRTNCEKWKLAFFSFVELNMKLQVPLYYEIHHKKKQSSYLN